MSAEFNKERCQKRNRRAALRHGIDSAHVSFLSDAGGGDGVTVTFFEGKLPKTAPEALAAINRMLPEGAQPLAAGDVYIHYVEAANNNFVSDRFMFLGSDTLRNIARDGASGVAFMNSHRTGGLSTDAEFPFGKTFAGQFQRGTDGEGRQIERALLGFYMLRGIRPNGEAGPSTDDLDRNIRGGTLFDVSVGLHGGEKICDVCDEPVYGAETNCPHLPGTHHSMSQEDRRRQADRGVPGGRATYTYAGGRLGEVSGVFDGAVRGAGFRKAVELAASLGRDDLRLAREVYGGLTVKEEQDGNESFFKRLSDSIAEGFGRAVGGHKPPATPPAQGAGHEEVKAEMADSSSNSSNENGAEVERLRKDSEELARIRQERRREEASNFAKDAVAKNRTLLPFGAEGLEKFYGQLADDDAERPLSEGSRVEQLRSLLSAIPGHNLTKEQAAAELPEGAVALSNNEGDAGPASVEAGQASIRKFAQRANATGPRPVQQQ